MTEIVKAAVLNAVKLSTSAVNVTVSKQLGSKYPNMNKINNMLTNSIEQVQQMDAVLQGSEHGQSNPLTDLINAMAKQSAPPPPEQPIVQQPAIDYNLLAKAIAREQKRGSLQPSK